MWKVAAIGLFFCFPAQACDFEKIGPLSRDYKGTEVQEAAVTKPIDGFWCFRGFLGDETIDYFLELKESDGLITGKGKLFENYLHPAPISATSLFVVNGFRSGRDVMLDMHLKYTSPIKMRLVNDDTLLCAKCGNKRFRFDRATSVY
jgi:hypothetical protein